LNVLISSQYAFISFSYFSKLIWTEERGREDIIDPLHSSLAKKVKFNLTLDQKQKRTKNETNKTKTLQMKSIMAQEEILVTFKERRKNEKN